MIQMTHRRPGIANRAERSPARVEASRIRTYLHRAPQEVSIEVDDVIPALVIAVRQRQLEPVE